MCLDLLWVLLSHLAPLHGQLIRTVLWCSDITSPPRGCLSLLVAYAAA